jgi:hypothetical protein
VNEDGRSRRRGGDGGTGREADGAGRRRPSPGKVASSYLIGNANPPRHPSSPGKQTLTTRLPVLPADQAEEPVEVGGAAPSEETGREHAGFEDPPRRPAPFLGSFLPPMDDMESTAMAPGTQQQVAQPVQRKATREAAAADPSAVAAQATQGAGSPLPYGDQIQASFGRHDVSGIRAFQGGETGPAMGAFGAVAFAHGDAVAFGGAPDLHTAAHEAAHVVQQRGGVQLKGGIDQPGDAYEQHADQVADAVVAGRSAESLLDRMAGGTPGHAVQRRSESGSLVSATEYLKLNDRAAGEGIMRHLLAITPPQPHARLAWHNLGAFYKRLFKQLDRVVYVFDNPTDLAQLVYPQDPYALIDSVRPIAGKQNGMLVGTWNWAPTVGAVLAEMIEEALVASLYRIGPRWLHVAELGGPASGTVLVDPEAIPRSHQMDRAVVPALCEQGVLDVIADKHASARPARSSSKPLAQPAGVGLRPVEYVWMGQEGKPELWNWVHVTSPADATVEEVAAALFPDTAESHGEKHGDYLAFAMTAAPPLFGLPGHWAIKFDEAKRHAPATVSSKTDEIENNQVTLAGSSVADEQALREAHVDVTRQVAPAKGAGAASGTLVQDCLSQATYLKSTLGAWHLEKSVDPTLTFLGRRMAELADASKLAKWQPVLAGQKDKLSRIGSAMVELDRAVATLGIKSKQGADARPLRDIILLYGDAAGTSHLLQTSETLIQRAAAQQATLALRGVQSATRDLGSSADMLRDSTPRGDDESNRLNSAAVHIDEDSHKLQGRMMRGEKVDPQEIDQVTVNAGEIALKSKVHAIAVQLDALEKAAHDAGDGFFATLASLFSSDFRGLEFETSFLKHNLEGITQDMDWEARAAGLGLRIENQKDADEYKRETMRVRKEGLARGQGQFAAMAANGRIKNFLEKGASLVKWQSFRTACVKLAALIGISIVGGALGGMVARGVGGMMMGSAGVAAMEDLSIGAQMVARGTGLVAETAVTSVGQTAIFGDRLSDSFLENMLMSLGSAGILKAIGHQAETLAQVERASQSLWQKAGAAGKLVLREGAAITGHTIMGAALGYVSHRIVTGKKQPPPETLEEWLLQGASIAVGRYVGKAMEARMASAKKLAAIKDFAPGKHLLVSTTALHERAIHAEASPRTDEAAELLAKRHEVLSEESKALEELEKSPEKMKAAGLHSYDVRHMKADVNAQLAEVHSRAFAEMPLQYAGLEELIPGAQWKGSRDQIVDAIEKARKWGVKVEARPPQGEGKTWHVELEGRPLEIAERVDAKRAAGPRAPHEDHAGAAERVPDSHFVGTGAGRKPVTLPEIQQQAEHAVTLLNSAATAVTHSPSAAAPFFDSLGTGEIMVTVPGGPSVRVKFEPMAAGDDVARHNYRKGQTARTCTVFVSEKARPQDLTRAIAHELAEVQSIAAGAEVGKSAMRRGSTSEELDAHDVGRKAEVQVLLYQAERAPTGDTATELEALVTHLGFDPKKIGTDARAKRIFGEDEVARVDEVLNKPRITIKAGDYKPKGEIVGDHWVFVIEVQLPNGRSTNVADGAIKLKPSPTEPGKFVPDDTQTLDFSLNNQAEVAARRWRIKLEGAEKLSDFVIKSATQQFEKKFHANPTLGGMLAWDNKARFQHAYAEVMRKHPRMDPQAAADLAILQTPYGSARASAGYDVKVTATGTTRIVTGDPPRVVNVPESVTAIAKKR